IGNASGTTEEVGRLQLGSAGADPKARSGALTINVTNNGGTRTRLSFASYSRGVNNLSSTFRPMNTANFTAHEGAGSLGKSVSGPQILLGSTVPTQNSLLASTDGSPSENLGWATVNGRDFAGYDTNGVRAVATSPAPAGTGSGSSTTNALLTGNLTLGNLNYA